MIYLVSFIVYLIVFAIGVYFIAIHSKKATAITHGVCAVGFVIQLLINYLFWGNVSAFGFLSNIINNERTLTNLLILFVTSVVCYGLLFVVFAKLNDYYHE
ncbi:hypothetical protein [Moraxella equi]|uniref:Uncharacterized protein n=1 Tax=Moraxella equi TaxID=60442 RepID=A0A378QPK7_9GAMM|nr:hypothetical protein [Moraxella equi]OPH39713.1 hypothetical protein B5J93_02800 [Moraxella equi]STZ02816.1 Uncharacterised protein [Moraxella equi]